MRFKLYYDDKTTFSNEDGTWEEAPSDGVLFVVVWQNGIRETFSSSDYYFMHDGVVGNTSDINPLLRKLGFVKFGRWTSHKIMEQVADMVRKDA